jgi:hypothetical protein
VLDSGNIITAQTVHPAPRKDCAGGGHGAPELTTGRCSWPPGLIQSAIGGKAIGAHTGVRLAPAWPAI